MLPTFLARLADPNIKNVLLSGCGGGFDFLQGATLLPELHRLGKRVVIGSFSFGDPGQIEGAEVVYTAETGAIVKRVMGHNEPPSDYGPEVHLANYLDSCFPDDAPHFVYAYYARAFTVPALTAFYQKLMVDHKIDAIILVDGGSDSLMTGEEAGLGDPIEDAVSVATVAGLSDLKLKLLVSVGLGADRFNGVSDAASLRAIAELTAAGGFLGAVSLEPTSPGFLFYKRCIDYVYQNQTFRSALSGFILSAGEGFFGNETIPPLLLSRVRPGKFFVWPLMAMLWAFDVDAVARRSRTVEWIRDCTTVRELHFAFQRGRASLPQGPREVENLPAQEEMQAE